MPRETEISKGAEIAGMAVGITTVLSTFVAILWGGSLVIEPSLLNTLPNSEQQLTSNIPFTPSPKVSETKKDDQARNGTQAATRSPTNVSAVRSTQELEGKWRQHINGSVAADFDVRFNQETEQYEMALAGNMRQGFTNTRGISNIRYDGITWSFDSDWGYKIGKFVLKKMDGNTFEGVVDGSRNKWIRINVPASAPSLIITPSTPTPQLQATSAPLSPPRSPRQTVIPVRFTAAEQAKIDKFCSQYGSDVKAVDETEMTLLHRAILNYDGIEIVKFLVSEGADVNAQNNRYRASPLWHAVFFNNLEVAKFLVEKGADINAKSANNQTPLELANERGEPAMIQYLSGKSTAPTQTPINQQAALITPTQHDTQIIAGQRGGQITTGPEEIQVMGPRGNQITLGEQGIQVTGPRGNQITFGEQGLQFGRRTQSTDGRRESPIPQGSQRRINRQ